MSMEQYAFPAEERRRNPLLDGAVVHVIVTTAEATGRGLTERAALAARYWQFVWRKLREGGESLR